MVTKAKANVGILPFGEKKQETLIELQDNRTQKQIQHQQLQDEQNKNARGTRNKYPAA